MALEIQEKYGIPIVNRRVSITPIAGVLAAGGPEAFVQVAHALDAAAAEIGIDFVGGFSALVQKGFTARDTALIQAIPQAIARPSACARRSTWPPRGPASTWMP